MKPDIDYIRDSVKRALVEDVDSGDLSGQIYGEENVSSAEIIVREEAVLCGIDWFEESFRQLDQNIHVMANFKDGDVMPKDVSVATLQGSTKALLTGERTAINFLQFMSGVATRSHDYANQITVKGIQLLDTRKTIPGLRREQKYAVRIGGCGNHRVGLFDATILKENHIKSAGSISGAVEKFEALPHGDFLEVEVENLGELDEAVGADVSRIMLDNFSLEDLRLAAKRYGHRVQLEVSGGILDGNLSDLQIEGLSFISIGDLTKNISAIDYSMRVTS